MKVGAVLFACLLSGGLSKHCYDQTKCYGRFSYSLQYILCDQAATTPCKISYDYPVCSKRKGDSVECAPDWFHWECHCRDLGPYENTATAGERCVCQVDKRAVGIVAGLGAAALLFAALTLFYSKRFSNMKRAAHTAQVEMRVLSRMLETDRNGLESIQEQGVEKDSSPPPQYEERIDNQEGNDYQRDCIYHEHGENGIYPVENIYSDMENSSTISIAEACVV